MSSRMSPPFFTNLYLICYSGPELWRFTTVVYSASNWLSFIGSLHSLNPVVYKTTDLVFPFFTRLGILLTRLFTRLISNSTGESLFPTFYHSLDVFWIFFGFIPFFIYIYEFFAQFFLSLQANSTFPFLFSGFNPSFTMMRLDGHDTFPNWSCKQRTQYFPQLILQMDHSFEEKKSLCTQIFIQLITHYSMKGKNLSLRTDFIHLVLHPRNLYKFCPHFYYIISFMGVFPNS